MGRRQPLNTIQRGLGWVRYGAECVGIHGGRWSRATRPAELDAALGERFRPAVARLSAPRRVCRRLASETLAPLRTRACRTGEGFLPRLLNLRCRRVVAGQRCW